MKGTFSATRAVVTLGAGLDSDPLAQDNSLAAADPTQLVGQSSPICLALGTCRRGAR